MLWQNRSSLVGCNVAVMKTIGIWKRTNSLNWRILGRKFGQLANSVWLLSMTMQCNRWVTRNKLTNCWNALLTADSGVTKTIDAASTAWSPCHIEHVTPLLLHRTFKSSCNDANGMTMMLVPPWEQNAGNMNIKLFLAPIPIITNIGLILFITAWIACFCSSWNCACWSIYVCNSLWILASCMYICRSICMARLAEIPSLHLPVTPNPHLAFLAKLNLIVYVLTRCGALGTCTQILATLLVKCGVKKKPHQNWENGITQQPLGKWWFWHR